MQVLSQATYLALNLELTQAHLTSNCTNLCVSSEGAHSCLMQLILVELCCSRVVFLLGICGYAIVLSEELGLQLQRLKMKFFFEVTTYSVGVSA